MSDKTLLKVTEAQERILGERFCTTCQVYRKLAEGPGMSKTSGKGKRVTRWVCETCCRRKGWR